MIDRNPIQVAISSGGASPVLVRYIREKLETQLPQNLSLLQLTRVSNACESSNISILLMSVENSGSAFSAFPVSKMPPRMINLRLHSVHC